MLPFDTGKKLEKAFTQEQFAALVEVLESREDKAASKVDLKETELRLQKEIEVVRAELRETELRTQKEIAALRTELVKEVESVRKEIALSKVEVLKWTASLLVVQTAAIIGAVAALMK